MPLPNDPQTYPPTQNGPLFGAAQFVWDGAEWVAGGVSAGASGGGGAAGSSAALTDHSGAIATANTAQSLLPANAARLGFLVSAQADIWISLTTTALAESGGGSFKVAAGLLYESPSSLRPVGAVSIICATAAAAYTCQDW